MKFYFVAVLFLWVGFSNQAQQTDCVANVPEEPLLRYNAKIHKSKPAIEKTKENFVEKYQHKDGTRLRISRGGCLRYIDSYTFTGLKKIPGSIKDQAKLAASLFKKFQVPPGRLTRSLESVAKSGEFFKTNKFSCGYGTCEINQVDKSLAVVFWFDM